MNDRDEHSPYYQSPEDQWDASLPGIHWLWYAIAAGMLILVLGGCDDYERQLAAAEYKTRFFNGCMPRKGDTVTAQWVKGELICKRITPTGRYGKTFPHAEVRVATVEGQ